MPTLPALGGKLKSTMPTRRSTRSVRRSATSLATRAASISARSGQECIARAPSIGKEHAREQPVQVPPAESERPPKTIGLVAPSSSGIATMMVVSTGIRPRSEAPHCSRVWNSVGCAARKGTSSRASMSSAALASL